MLSRRRFLLQALAGCPSRLLSSPSFARGFDGLSASALIMRGKALTLLEAPLVAIFREFSLQHFQRPIHIASNQYLNHAIAFPSNYSRLLLSGSLDGLEKLRPPY